MAKTAYYKWREKYGVSRTTQKPTNNNDEGKQSNSAPSTRTTPTGNTNSKSAYDKWREKYGVSGAATTNPATTKQPTKKHTDFNTETKQAYTSAKSKANSKTTITSAMSEEDRKKRIKDIDAEIRNLNYKIQGLSRGASYVKNDGRGYLTNQTEEAKKKIEELSAKRKSLERVGTFTASEIKQFEIEDAKAEKAKLPNYNPTSRVSPSGVDAFAENAKAHTEADKRIDTLEREKALYDDVTKFGDVVNEDGFGGQWRANFRYADLTRDADKAMSEYIKNPTEENKQLAYAYDAFVKAYQKNNEKALDDENVKASWLTKSAAGYLPQFRDQIVPELVGGTIGTVLFGKTGGSIGAALGTYSQMYDVMRGSVYRTLLSEGVDEETALKAAEDEALISSLIESGGTAISWLLLGGGKAMNAIGNAATRSVAKGTANSATKYVANRALTYAAKQASQPLWKGAVKGGLGIVGNALSEYGEEFAQGAVSIANRERATGGNPIDGKWDLIQDSGDIIAEAVTGKNPEAFAELHEQGKEGFKIGLMFGGSQAVINNTVSRLLNAKTIQDQNEVLDFVRNDEETLDALVEEGKESGKGTVSEKIATEIETARENGKEITREQVKRLIASTDVYINAEEKAAEYVEKSESKNDNTPINLYAINQRLDARSQNNETINAEDVKRATGFGNSGAELVATYSNVEGETFRRVVAEAKPSYMAGMENPDLDVSNMQNVFKSPIQLDAFKAGQIDRKADDIARNKGLNDAVVNKGSGFVTQHFLADNLPSDVTNAQVQTLDLMAKALGVKSYVTTGLKGNAEINRATGEVPIDANFEREVNIDGKTQKVSIVFHAAHEMAVHRVLELAPEEGSAFMYEMYKHLAGSEPSTFTLADQKRNAYAKQGEEISLAEAMEEVTANNILKLYNYNEEKFHKAIESIVNGTNTKAKQGLRKYIEYLTGIIRKIGEFLTGKSAKDRAEIQAELNEIRRLRDMFETAFAKAVENKKAIEAKQNAETNSAKNLEIKTNEEYNGNISHSLKWHTDLTYRQVQEVEKWLGRIGNPESTKITDTANWYKGRMDGADLFVIYSDKATILYERKGSEGMAELKTLQRMLEVIENGKSIIGKQRIIDRLLGGDWMSKQHNLANNNAGSGRRGSNTGNAPVLQGKPSAFIGSKAFRNVIRNLFEIQARVDTEQAEKKSHSLKDSEGNTLTEAQAEFFEVSKVRDENGNLLVVYHGTRNGGFTVFNRNHNYYTDNRDMADSYAPSGVLYKGYLNITKPYTIDAGGEKWSAIPVPEEVKRMLDSAGSSTFKERGKWCTSVADIVAAVSDLVDEGEADYDGVIVRNVDDTGSYYKGSAKNIGNDYISFSSEQFKDIDNKNPTNNPDINFSLKETVEETRELVAVHNVSATKLLKTLKLGGMPMPSIAITRAREGYNNFGDISLVFGKETIDPRFMRSNKVFSGDAWTPTYPQIAYKLNTKAQEKIKKKIDALVPGNVQSDLGGTHLDSSNMESELNRHGDMVTSYRYNYAMKYAFLKDNNVSFELPTEEKPFYSYGEVSNSAVISFAHKMVDGLKTVNALYEQHSSKLMADTELINAIASVLNEEMLSNLEENTEAYQKFAEEPLYKSEDIDLSTVLGMLEAARRYFHSNGKIESKIDYRNAREKIDNYFNSNSLQEEYEYWLKNLFSDVVAKEGIRNNKDSFTPSGNRRSFEALHYEHTLENVIKAMKEEGIKGIGGFGGGNIFGASTLEYNSIDEIKTDAQNRMKTLPESKYDEIKKGFSDRLLELAYSLPIHKDSFTAVDDAANMLIEAVSKFKTKSGMANYLRTESKGWANYSDYIVDDLIELVNDIRNMPVAYFEAKPQRAVGFDEIKAVIMPSQESYEDDLSEVKRELKRLNIPILEYEYGDNNDRLKALNSLEAVKFSLKGTNDINTKDVKRMAEIIEHLKGEFETTKFAKADQKTLAKMTRGILKDYSSQADFDETFKAIDELYLYMANGENGHPAVWEDMYYKAYEVAQKIVENALVVDDSMYNEYKHLRDYLRNTPMKFYAGFDDVPSSYENFNEFRKMNMGRLKFTSDGMSIDSVYQELSSLYPEFFNSEEQMNTADQLEMIVDVLDNLKPTEINQFDGQIMQVSTDLANDLISRFFDIPQAKPTFADKAERRVVEAKIKGSKKVEAVRQQKDEKIKKLIKSQRSKTKKLLEKAKSSKAKAVEKEKVKRRESLAKMSESQKVKVLRAKIMRHTSDLNKKLLNPTDNQHIPHELQGAVAKLLECINLESNYTYDTESHSYKKNDEGLPSKRTQAFNELKKVYGNIAASVVVDPDLISDDGLLSGVISLADKRIVDMTSNELDTVWQTIRAIEASVSTANKLFSQSKFATILETAEALKKANAGKKGKTELVGLLGKGQELTTLNMLTPETYLHCLGEAGDSIFRMLRDAQDKHISIMKEVADFTHETLKGVNVNSLEKTIHTVKLGGEEVKLSTAQLMELYVLMKREQAVDHIMIGGILPDVTKGKGVKLNTRSEPIRNLTLSEISEALSVLTDEQRQIADKLQKFVSNELSSYGNEASMQVYNYEKFLEENYWTIRTNKQEIASDVGKDTAVTTVANKGMAKGTTPHANTSVRIGSIFDTFAAHSSDMATYAAWLGTSEDVNRIRNFVFWEDGVRTGTVKGILDTVHGIHGSEYLQKLLTDIAIGVKGTDNMNPFDKFIGHYKAASVGANLRVIIQQPTAILRALDMIDARYLAEGAVKPLKGWAKAKKYAPIAQWKDWGHFDINTGRQMKDVLFDNANLLEKTKQIGMWGASLADSLAWGQLWNAVEAETKAKHKELEVGTDAYYETVAKRFTEIVDHTQVVDGILQRSQIMRSPGALTKMATSFMGEPTKQYNMAMSAAYDAKNLKGDARKKAIARLGRTAVTLAVAGIVNACVQSIIDAMRDDDKEKDYWERWTTAFVGDGEETNLINSNLGDTVNPFNYVPFAKDVVSIMQGYDVKRMDTESITKTYNAAKNMYKAVTGTGKYTIAEASAQLFAEIARMYGLPVANVKRDVKALVMSIAGATDNALLQYRIEKAMLDINYAGNSKNFIDILYNAYNNDKEDYEIIYKDMLNSGYDAQKIQNGMETRMKKSQGVKEASELNKRYMAPATERKYDNSLNKIKSSKTWKSANTKQRKDAEAELYNFLTSTSEDMVKTRAEASTYGVDETEYTLWQLAKEMANTDGKDGLTKLEKANALKMLDLDSDSAWDLYLFKDDSKSATYVRDNGVQSDTYAEFIEALDKYDKPTKSGKYGSYTQEEAYRAINSLKGLSRQEKATLWQSVNSSWKAKNNPFR